MGRIFYIMGKSASGKDHIYRYVKAQENLHLKELVLYTTRPMRDGEEDGREYFFTDEKKYEQLLQDGKIIESRAYDTVYGVWRYFTADDGQIALSGQDYIGIGTLESYEKLREHFGEEALYPIYIEVEDGIRLERALKRERKQKEPKYAELCRRFLADCEDFSEEKLLKAGIVKRFTNNSEISDCQEEIVRCIEKMQKLM